MAIWGGKKTESISEFSVEETQEIAAAKKVPVPKEASMGKREDEGMRSGEVNAILGRGTEFDGKLSFEGDVRIAGKFTGEIFSKDRLQIDDSARVGAEITAGSVVVFGEVQGNIKASQLVELKSSARVRGNIETPSLVIEKGVLFEGACKMENLAKNATVMPLKQADEKKKESF